MDQVNDRTDALPGDVERFVPGEKGEIWIEHWHRYHFAARWAPGKRVLDVACGEGYGSALLARTASAVTGVDIASDAVERARSNYALANLAFECASCERLPFPDASFDLAVSFETIEHIEAQAAFLDELARVLAPDGVLVLSSPNRAEYSDARGFHNPFHVKELYREELAKLVEERFPFVAWYGQRATFFSVIAPESSASATGQLVEVAEENGAQAVPRLGSPMYFLLVAGRQPDAIAAPPTLSVLADRGDWVHKDYEKVMGYLNAEAARAKALEAEIAARDARLAELQSVSGPRSSWLRRLFSKRKGPWRPL